MPFFWQKLIFFSTTAMLIASGMAVWSSATTTLSTGPQIARKLDFRLNGHIEHNNIMQGAIEKEGCTVGWDQHKRGSHWEPFEKKGGQKKKGGQVGQVPF